MLKSSGYQTLKNYKMSCKCERDVLFLLLKADTKDDSRIFADSAQNELITNKNS
jgi:hypothetical protein